MNIIVCIKQVPAAAGIEINRETGSPIREKAPGIMNPNDKNAIEEALRLKEKHGGQVTVITMGPPQAEEALREALGMGADKAILLSDSAFAGADTAATSYTLGCAIQRMKEEFDLILCGQESQDGMTAQVGPQLAVLLNLPYITFVHELKISGQTIRAKKAFEGGYQLLEASLPVLVTVSKNINLPRIPPVDKIIEAYREKEITVWTFSDLGIEPEKVGLKGSPTIIMKTFTAELKKSNKEIMKTPSAKDAAQEIIRKLKEKGLF